MIYNKKNILSNHIDSEPLVSIIIPVYNGEKYIDETILSVKNQTFRNWELIIVDNCSIDNTEQHISLYKSSKIRIFKTKKNSGGPAVPRNIGIKNAKGKYLAFLDADDIWKSTKLEAQLGYMKEQHFVCTLASIIDSNSNLTYNPKKVNNRSQNYSDLVNRNSIINSSVLVSREKFLKIMFDEDILLNGIEDYHSYLRYTNLYGPILVIGEPLIKRRVIVNSLGNSFPPDKRLAKSVYCLTKVVLAKGKYNNYFYGLFRRILSYLKRNFVDWFIIFFK